MLIRAVKSLTPFLGHHWHQLYIPSVIIFRMAASPQLQMSLSKHRLVLCFTMRDVSKKVWMKTHSDTVFIIIFTPTVSTRWCIFWKKERRNHPVSLFTLLQLQVHTISVIDKLRTTHARQHFLLSELKSLFLKDNKGWLIVAECVTCCKSKMASVCAWHVSVFYQVTWKALHWFASKCTCGSKWIFNSDA